MQQVALSMHQHDVLDHLAYGYKSIRSQRAKSFHHLSKLEAFDLAKHDQPVQSGETALMVKQLLQSAVERIPSPYRAVFDESERIVASRQPLKGRRKERREYNLIHRAKVIMRAAIENPDRLITFDGRVKLRPMRRGAQCA